MVICLFGMLQVNQRSPWKSSQASCTPQPGIITDGVPSDQSLPSFCTKFARQPGIGVERHLVFLVHDARGFAR